jgi:hypothetical protein
MPNVTLFAVRFSDRRASIFLYVIPFLRFLQAVFLEGENRKLKGKIRIIPSLTTDEQQAESRHVAQRHSAKNSALLFFVCKNLLKPGSGNVKESAALIRFPLRSVSAE